MSDLNPDRIWQAALSAHAAGDLERAIPAYRQYLQVRPQDARAWSNLGIGLKVLGNLPEAILACQRAVELDGQNANAFNHLGICLMAKQDAPGAIREYHRALAIDADFHECWCNLGLALAAMNDPEAAVGAFKQSMELDATYTEALVQFIHHSLQICAWAGLDAAVGRLSEVIRKDAGEVNPFSLLSVCTDPNEMLRAGGNFARRVEAGVAREKRPLIQRVPASERLRVGYLSGDFHSHATAYLMAEVFEAHDRKRFEVFAYSYGPDDGTTMRQRLVSAFEHFVDLDHTLTAEAAQRIATDGLDLLIDLKGYTQMARPGILALRPAPVQAEYLGYPATMGADFIDFALVDHFVVPEGAERFYSERLVFLPGCYQPNDSKREVTEPAPSRADCGLPDDAVVLCCFNQPYKITPDIFMAWLTLMRDHPGTVLWLLAFNPAFGPRLKSIAAANGINPDRLILAQKLPLTQHLSRLRHADLFVDTFPCSAHTTASDALWAGVPLVTVVGATFASRVAGSLLHAMGLDDLIAADLAAYLAIARQLLRDHSARGAVKSRIDAARSSSALFDGAAAARSLESAYLKMVGRLD
jgi:predicted O-linked N-acetylglucosamine transferase (SPINDLY family)